MSIFEPFIALLNAISLKSLLLICMSLLQTSFSNAVRTKARLSIKGTADHQGLQATAVGPPEMPTNMSMSTVMWC